MIIVISGNARSGKDTCASILAEQYIVQHGHVLFSPNDLSCKIADIVYDWTGWMKEGINLMLGWDERHSNGPLKEVVDTKWGVSPREVYQSFGTEYCHTYVNDLIFAMKACEYAENRPLVIIPGVRYSEDREYIENWCKENGRKFITVLITKDDASIGSASTHISENRLHEMKYDYVIENNGRTIEDLRVTLNTTFYKTMYNPRN